MFGAIIGDIVVGVVEFNIYRSKDFELFGDGCLATDDSIMTLAVAKAINRKAINRMARKCAP
jgi:type I restriction enzyme M protein